MTKKLVTYGFLVLMVIIFGSFLKTQKKYAEFHSAVSTVNLGNIISMDTVVVKLPYTNKGKIPLVIDSIVTSCECNVIKYNKQPLEVGANDTIFVSFDGSIVGSFVKKVEVYSNSKNKKHQFFIRGKHKHFIQGK